MGLLADALYAYGQAVKRALPLLVVVTVILDALLLRSVDPAPLADVALWLGAYVGGTFLVVTALYVCYLYVTRSVSEHASTDGTTPR
jgi:hypothetical protein